jgi:hypothetical protein
VAETVSRLETSQKIAAVGALWAVEHEPDSDTYLLLDASGAYCAELHWSERGECWADFSPPFVAFSGPTTIADIAALQQLADLLRSVPQPAGRRPRKPAKVHT